MMNSIVALVLVFASGGSDLLDFVPAQTYWQGQNVEMTSANMLKLIQDSKPADVSEIIKKLNSDKFEDRDAATKKLQEYGPEILPQLEQAMKSSDAEVASRAKEAADAIGTKTNRSPMNRLMAIRALGELKAKDAVPALKVLVDSKTAFEAEYAQQALAAIEGKAYKRPAPTEKDWQSDLYLLPQNCGVVGQVKMQSGTTDMAGLLKSAGMDMDDASMKGIVEQVSKLSALGNVRFNGMTMGVADNVGNKSGYVIFIARGKYDPKVIAEFLKTNLRLKPQEFDGFDNAVGDDRSFILIPVSPEQLVMVVGPDKENMPLKELAQAIKAGKGKLSENAEMVKLIKSVDTSSIAWAVCRVSEAYKVAPVLAPFESLTLTVTEKDNQLAAKLQAVGSDAEKSATAIEQFKKGQDEIHNALTRAVEQMPTLQDILDVANSVEIKTDGGNVTITAGSKKSLQQLIFKAIVPTFVTATRRSY